MASADAFRRYDDTDDALFYAWPRRVVHIEAGATKDDIDAARAELATLAAWLKLGRVKIARTIRSR